VGKYITTYTKKHINPKNGNPDDIDYQDIAHSLSLQCRANGHFPRFYSVAQHCLDCMREAKARCLSKRLQFAALIHDSAEAYFGDIPSPVKNTFPDILDFEDKLLEVIYKKYLGTMLDEKELEIIAEIDHTLFCHEFLAIMGEQTVEVMPRLYSNPDFKTRPAIEIEEEYKRFFRKYEKNGK